MFTEIVTFEIPNLPAALKEVHGVIKSNGLLISKTPCLGGTRPLAAHSHPPSLRKSAAIALHKSGAPGKNDL